MPTRSRKRLSTDYRCGFTLLELLAVIAVVTISIGLAGCGGPKPPKVPPEHVKLTIHMPDNSEADSLDVLVNNMPLCKVKKGGPHTASFAALASGNNTIEFVNPDRKSSSQSRELFATARAELNVTIVYTYKSFAPDIFQVNVLTT